MPETLDIFKNKKTGLYLLQRKCPDPQLRAATWIGQPEVLTGGQLKNLDVGKILDALESSLKPCADLREIKHFTDEEHSKFCSAHHCVTVTRWPDGGGQLELYPLRRVRGGYKSIKGEKRTVAAANIQSDLIDEILSAFEVVENE